MQIRLARSPTVKWGQILTQHLLYTRAAPSSHPPPNPVKRIYNELKESTFGSCVPNAGLMIQWNVLRTELTNESCGQIPSWCQSVHSCWLSCIGRVESWKTDPQPAFLQTCAAHWGFSQLAFGWSTLKLLHLLFPFSYYFSSFLCFCVFSPKQL